MIPNPILYQIQTRDTLYRLSKKLNRKATLDDIPDIMLDEWKQYGFEWIWLLGVWNTGEAGRNISRSRPWWWEEFRNTLPDLTIEDISGSCFSIKNYTVHPDFGGEEALSHFRQRLQQRGMKLMLDFVPNHTAPDHPWVYLHPEFYISGDREKLISEPDKYTTVDNNSGESIFAYGRDPNFPGWQDTLQLDYSNPDLQQAMKQELLDISTKCDGLRCDMAMLLNPDIFEKTWKMKIDPFWPDAIKKVKARNPEFSFLAEVYWDLEWEMQRQGFDYCYDKRLYDRLENPDPVGIKAHLSAGLEYQGRLARFLENHDEPRAAKTFQGKKHLAAAIITYFSPGMKFFHQGQLEGYKVRIPVHLNRGPQEIPTPEIKEMYDKILDLLKDKGFREGKWHLLDCKSYEDDHINIDEVLAFFWNGPEDIKHLIIVNYSPNYIRCKVKLPDTGLKGNLWKMNDLLNGAENLRDGSTMVDDGLRIDIDGWGVFVFGIKL